MNQSNRVRERLQSGEFAVGLKSITHSKAFIDICGQLGLDYAWFDFEHIGETPMHSPIIEDFTRASEAADIELIFRLPSGEPHLIRKVIDAGVRNLVIPRVETAEEVERAIRAARFTYQGESGNRGYGTAYASSWGSVPEEYAKREDDSVAVGIVIEREEAYENIEEILSVPELAFVWIGSQDFSVSLGNPLKPDTSKQIEYEESIQAKCREQGIPMGTTLHNVEEAREAKEEGISEGFQLLNIGSDHEMVRSTIRQRYEEIADAHIDD